MVTPPSTDECSKGKRTDHRQGAVAPIARKRPTSQVVTREEKDLFAKARAIVGSDGTAVDGARLARPSQGPVRLATASRSLSSGSESDRAGSSRRPRSRLMSVALLALATAAFLALTAASASAALVFPPNGEIAGSGTGPFSPLDSESVAVNNANGHILIADSGAGLVRDFASASDTSPT